MRARITAIASYLPKKVLSNADFEKMLDTSDEWIVTRTGMKERRIAAPGENSSDMGEKAAKEALKKAGLSPEDVDLVIVGTMTPDYLAPSTAAIIQNRIGATRACAVDFQAACSGFIYGLSMAKAYVESGMYKNILLVATDKLSSFVDYTDRNTSILFGDGAGAVVVSGEGEGLAIRHVHLGADGEQAKLLSIPAGGCFLPASKETVEERQHYLKMNGKELFKHAVRRMEDAVNDCLKETSLLEEDISWIVPHQANSRIIDGLAKRFSMPLERVFKIIHKYGNTSASSVLIALDELLMEHEIKKGENLMLVAFGAGLTWGASVLSKI